MTGSVIEIIRNLGDALNRFFATLARADADAVVHRQHKDLAIADLPLVAAAAALDDRVDRGFDEVIVDGDLQLHLAKQIDFVFVTPIELGLALLSAEALAIEHGQAKDFDFGERGLHGLELAGLNNGDDEFHETVNLKQTFWEGEAPVEPWMRGDARLQITARRELRPPDRFSAVR